MLIRKRTLLTVVINIFVADTSCLASTYRERAYTFPKWGLPDSIKDCKKIGDFLCVVPVVPNEFVWEGHRIEVYESWLGQINWDKTWLGKGKRANVLYFKLKIDGKLKGEYRLHKRGLNLIFRSDPAVPLRRIGPLQYKSRSSNVAWNTFWRICASHIFVSAGNQANPSAPRILQRCQKRI